MIPWITERICNGSSRDHYEFILDKYIRKSMKEGLIHRELPT